MKKIVKNIIIVLIPIIILSQFAIYSYYYNKYKDISQEYNNIVELEKACNSKLGEYKANISEKDNTISNLEEQVNTLIDNKNLQPKLTAGTNITIQDNVISSTDTGVSEERVNQLIDTKLGVIENGSY